ncbi:ABC transporter permease [Nonomuraea sp. NPDC049695]|uniref:ABC transporter permease n=1 Tax=Nonomuraea sp. NPDC049695 TaxID=3154734 RepID=UPI003443ADD2
MRGEAIAFWAGVRKEWQVMARYPSTFVMIGLSAVLIPATYYAQALGYSGGSGQAMDAFAARAGTAQVGGFIYLGWAVYLWISEMLWGPGTALRNDRMQGSLEAVHLTPASRFSILFGPVAAQLLPAAVLFGVVGLMLRFAFGIPLEGGRLLGGLVIILASVPPLCGLGALTSVVVLYCRDADGVVEALRGVLGLICGVTYPIAVLPGWLQPISQALPPTQVLDLLRDQVLNATALAEHGTRVAMLPLAGVVLAVLATAVLGRALRSSQRTGRLGQF